MGNKVSQERWIIEVKNDRFSFAREINGRIEDSYAPVNKDKAAVFAAAIIQGLEPPRLLTPAERDFQLSQGHQNLDKPLD